MFDGCAGREHTAEGIERERVVNGLWYPCVIFAANKKHSSHSSLKRKTRIDDSYE